MPYIEKERRKDLGLIFDGDLDAGTLNYLFVTLAEEYLKQHGESYQTYSDINSAFDLGKAEYQRRRVFPYEDKKKKANGDVFK